MPSLQTRTASSPATSRDTFSSQATTTEFHDICTTAIILLRHIDLHRVTSSGLRAAAIARSQPTTRARSFQKKNVPLDEDVHRAG